MSMLSAQCDKLRAAAQTYRKMGNHSAEGMLLDAADTIWKLRDDLQRSNASVQDAEHDESMVWDRVRKAEAESTKLREFTARLANALGIDSEWCDTSWCDTDCMVEFGCQPACCGGETRCPAWARLKELGVVS